jgi:tripartite-type tricarboxylate transporter receptor subunit TctC
MPIRMTRRQFAGGTAATAGSLLAGVGYGHADGYPQKPVTIINGFAAGSISDAVARVIAQFMQQDIGQTFVVENKVGAGGLLGASTVQRAQPDGYTLLLTVSSVFSGAALYKSLPFDPVKDFTHIARIGSFPSFVAVNPSVPVDSMAALVAYAKANPGKLSYGFGNNVGQLVGETLKKRTGIDIVRVAYRSNPAAVTDLIAGHIQIMIPDLNTGLPSVKSGRIRPLAMLNHGRIAAMPEVPSLHETVLPGFDILPWCGFSGPPNLPQAVVDVLARSVQKALADPTVQRRLADTGTVLFPGGPQEFSEYVKAQLANWTAVIKEVGIQPE